MSLLDEAFEHLQKATVMEKTGVNKIEAATKYYEAVYLMRQYLQRLPQTQQEVQTRQLLEEKIQHYGSVAAKLLSSLSEDDQSTVAQTLSTNTRMPLAKHCFFNEHSSVVPVQPPQPTTTTTSQQPRSQQPRSQPLQPLQPPPPPPPPTSQFHPSTPSSPRHPTSAVLNAKAAQANTKLSNAIDFDEQGQTNAAVSAYMTAAQIYLETIKISETQPNLASITQVLKRRLQGALDRVEQLKQPKSSAQQQQQQRGNKHIYNQQNSRDLDANSVYSNNTNFKQPQQQQQQRQPAPLTQEEISVLKRSSMIASGLFMPWSDEEATQLSITSTRSSSLSSSPTLYTDPNGDLALSDKQRKRFFRWARPSEIIKIRQRQGVKQNDPILIRNITPYSIRQQFVTDCSFIASLCICAAFERRFRKRLVTSIIYPQNNDGIPIYNPSGQYMVKLWLNGVARQVKVDDKLPIDKYGNLLCSHTTGSKSQLELWVSIIEKAYMKLCGGYDFPGSNSGVDLFSLTGWIPERIFFPKDSNKIRDFETPSDRAWERLYSANSFGDCLITVSTTKDITESQAETLGLVTGHAYAVLDVIQTKNGTKLLQLKNPWASKGWTGKFSSKDAASWRDPAFREEVGYNPELAAKHDDGVFWIRWEDVLIYFQNLQLSWNPALFPYRVTTHNFWPKNQGPIDDTFNVGENPQYIMSLSKEAISKKATIWILISRHVTAQEQEGSEVTDFLTIHLLKNASKKERIWYPHGPNTLVDGAYTNNPHVLTRYDITGSAEEYISLVLSQYKKSHDMGYTLSCFCTEPFTLGKPQKDLPHNKEVASSWTATTAGGPIGKQDFFRNPMYSLHLNEDSILQLRCSTVKAFAVNVMLIPVEKASKKGQRLTRMVKNPILDSGNYRHGFAITERKLISPGDYIMILSTYYPDQVGIFNFKLSSSKKLQIDPIP